MKNLNEKYSIVFCDSGSNMSTSHFKFLNHSDLNPSTIVSERNNLSPRNKMVVNKIQSFGDLEENWDSYDADIISKEVIDSSVRFVEKINQLNQDIYFAAPGPNGEISIELKSGTKNAEMLIYPNKKHKHIFFNDDKFEGQGNISIQKIPEVIRWLFSKEKEEAKTR